VCEVRTNTLFRKLRFNHLTYEVCCTEGYIDIKSLERNKCVSTDFTVMFWFKVTVLTLTCHNSGLSYERLGRISI